MVTTGYYFDSLDICFGLNSRIPEVTLGNLFIGVDARSRLCFSGRNLGALFEVICVGSSIINLKLFDAYRIITQGYLW